MSADFWAGYISGAAGILIGNPLDLIKVRIQADSSISSVAESGSCPHPTSYLSQFSSAGSLIRGATAPILGYGALNALLFMTYNRTSALLTPTDHIPSLWTTWVAGAFGGLATFVVSTPTELVKCRAQVSSPSSPSSTSPASSALHTVAAPTARNSPPSSWQIARHVLRTEGLRGLYHGGVVTALRDSIGYGFYFWSYELSTRYLASSNHAGDPHTPPVPNARDEALKVLLCGGLAGVITWASIFPLDVVKTRVQTQHLFIPETSSLLAEGASEASSGAGSRNPRSGAMQIARMTYRNEGLAPFFRGLGVCSVRAFIVNAAQWAVYEYVMGRLDPSRREKGGKVVEGL